MSKLTFSVNTLMLILSLYIMMQYDRQESGRLLHAQSADTGSAGVPLTHSDEYRHRRFECQQTEEMQEHMVCISWEDKQPNTITA